MKIVCDHEVAAKILSVGCRIKNLMRNYIQEQLQNMLAFSVTKIFSRAKVSSEGILRLDKGS